MKRLFWYIVLILVGVVTYIYVKIDNTLYTPIKVNGYEVLQIPQGATLKQIGSILADRRLIINEDLFVTYAKIRRVYPQIKAGEYLISGEVSSSDILDILSSGKLYYRRTTFREGMTAYEIIKQLNRSNMLSGEVSDLKEGEFLPETYTFSRGESREVILQKGKEAMERVLDRAWKERDKDLPLKNKQEMLILASIVEKETGIASERPKIASVFINRLRKNMLLQTDPTVIYAITKGKTDLGRSLTKRDLAVESPYNTYKYAGLPPTPICSPGKASIMAVAHPEKTSYLYFVASGNGGHNFAATLSEHNKNVRKWLEQQ